MVQAGMSSFNKIVLIMAISIATAVAQAQVQSQSQAQAKSEVASLDQAKSESVQALEEIQEVKVKPSWTYSFFSIGGLTPGQIDKGSGSYSAYNYISFNYKLSDKTKFSIRPVFYANTAGFDKFNTYQEQAVKLGDLHLVYAVNDYVKSERFGMSTSFKFYLPTSDSSKASKLILQFRPETYMQLDLDSRNSVTWVLKPDVYFQSQTAYFDSSTPQYDDGFYKFDPRKTTRIAFLEHYLEFASTLNRDFILKPAIGFKDEWTNGSDVEKLEGAHNTIFRTALALDIKLVKNWTFTPGIENNIKSTNPKVDVALYRPDETNYTLMISGAL